MDTNQIATESSKKCFSVACRERFSPEDFLPVIKAACEKAWKAGYEAALPLEKRSKPYRTAQAALASHASEPTDKDAQAAGWQDQAHRQEFLDNIHALAESIRHLAVTIKNQ